MFTSLFPLYLQFDARLLKPHSEAELVAEVVDVEVLNAAHGQVAVALVAGLAPRQVLERETHSGQAKESRPRQVKLMSLASHLLQGCHG